MASSVVEEMTTEQKAAAVIVSLGADKASKIYKHLSKDDIEKLTIEVAKLKHLEAEETLEVLDEFYTVVDLGGKILDVVVEHDLYGQIAVDLIIANRQDAEEFFRKMQASRVKPLKELTEDIHYHTIVTKDVSAMDRIEEALLKKGYLILASDSRM